MENMNDAIRESVRAKLGAKNMKRKDLAAKIGKSPQYVSAILKGTTGDVPEAWQQIFEVLGLKLVVIEEVQE